MKDYKEDFPILKRVYNGNKLVYFDNAATSQKPNFVLEAVLNYNKMHNGNPHRGTHILSMDASEFYDNARLKVQKFIKAGSEREIVFTKNASESLNLIARSYGEPNLKAGDKIVITIAEHHSNIVPWQRVAEKTGATLEYIYINPENGELLEEDFKKIDKNTKIVACTHISNVLGTIFPVEKIIKMAHDVGAVAVIDGCQSAPHIPVNVKEMDCDFYVFSGHKMLSSTGIGVLYGKEEILDKMEPFLMGGDMIEYVEEQSTTFNELPFKFEAGTQNIEGIVSLGSAIDYIEEVGFEYIERKDRELIEYLLEELKKIDHINIIGPKDIEKKVSLISFTVDDVHPHDVATILDTYGIAIRSGHHCAQPLGKFLEIPSSNRISPYFYNTMEEAEYFISKVKLIREKMGYGS